MLLTLQYLTARRYQVDWTNANQWTIVEKKVKPKTSDEIELYLMSYRKRDFACLFSESEALFTSGRVNQSLTTSDCLIYNDNDYLLGKET